MAATPSKRNRESEEMAWVLDGNHPAVYAWTDGISRLVLQSTDPAPLLRFGRTVRRGHLRGPYLVLDRTIECPGIWACQHETHYRWEYVYVVYTADDVRAIVGMLWPYLTHSFSPNARRIRRRVSPEHVRRLSPRRQFVIRPDRRTGLPIGIPKPITRKVAA
jgi:hypothetical protein